MLKALRNVEQGAEGLQTPQGRLIFLELLGLVESRSESQAITVTEAGTSLGRRGGAEGVRGQVDGPVSSRAKRLSYATRCAPAPPHLRRDDDQFAGRYRLRRPVEG